jgi:hypothetical protein
MGRCSFCEEMLVLLGGFNGASSPSRCLDG